MFLLFRAAPKTAKPRLRGRRGWNFARAGMPDGVFRDFVAAQIILRHTNHAPRFRRFQALGQPMPGALRNGTFIDTLFRSPPARELDRHCPKARPLRGESGMSAAKKNEVDLF